ncbi:MAG: hypothetical protein H7A36_05640 [Chlamydiales bacterium]|nr:hypothetical protein [Chlamydiales bacterium]
MLILLFLFSTLFGAEPNFRKTAQTVTVSQFLADALNSDTTTWSVYSANFNTERVEIALPPGTIEEFSTNTTRGISSTINGVTFSLSGKYPPKKVSNTTSFFNRILTQEKQPLLYQLNQSVAQGLALLYTVQSSSNTTQKQVVVTNRSVYDTSTNNDVNSTNVNVYYLNIAYDIANFNYFEVGTFGAYRSYFTVTER